MKLHRDDDDDITNIITITVEKQCRVLVTEDAEFCKLIGCFSIPASIVVHVLAFRVDLTHCHVKQDLKVDKKATRRTTAVAREASPRSDDGAH